jgi:hypothetical protein
MNEWGARKKWIALDIVGSEDDEENPRSKRRAARG